MTATQGTDLATGREQHLVELVDDQGRPTGGASVAAAHTAPGRLHRAFSIVLLDGDDRHLLQQRAEHKTRFALRWANACCGHPAPGQPLLDAAKQRLSEELGLTGVELREAGVHLYRAADPATDRVEYEYDHVLVGRVDSSIAPDPDPAEVRALRWIGATDLEADLDATPERYSPWLAGVVAAWRTGVSGAGPASPR